MITSFLESTLGQGILIAMIIVALVLASYRTKKEKPNSKALATTAMLIALAIVLGRITLFRMPQGGSVTPFAMLVIVLIGYFYGMRQGILAGVAYGLIDLMFGGYVLSLPQVMLDYILAYACLGFSGLFRGKSLIKGYTIGVIGRFISVFLAGVIFWGAYAPEGYNAVTWSLVYNGTYIGAEALLTLALLSFKQFRGFFESLLERV